MSGYVGSELELFSEARNWKAYFSRVLAPYVRGQVLEVGGGIGSNTPYLATPAVRGWTSVEPDRSLARRLQSVPRGTNCRLIGLWFPGLSLPSIPQLGLRRSFTSTCLSISPMTGPSFPARPCILVLEATWLSWRLPTNSSSAPLTLISGTTAGTAGRA